MKIIINPGVFQAALTVAQTAVKPRSTLPVLEHVHLEATDDRLTVSGTDLESRAWHTVACTVEEAGSITLPPKALDDFLGAIVPSEPVTLTVGAGHKAELVSGRTRIRLAGIDGDEFPVAPSYDLPAWDYTLAAPTFAALVRSTAFAAARDDSRPVLAGVLFRVADGVLTLAAADGFRLAIREVPVEAAPEVEVIVHARMLMQAARAVEKADDVRLVVDGRRSSLLVDSAHGCWAIRLIDGHFPDFRRIIPAAPPLVVTALRDDLLRASRLIRNVVEEHTDKDGRRVTTLTARLTVGADSIAVRAVGTAQDQEADIVILAERERGDDLAIGFNGGYLREAIEAIDAERVAIGLTGPASPGVLHGAGPRNGHLQVVMPMAIARGAS